VNSLAGVLVDSNVLLDVIMQDDEWLDWSSAAIERAAASARLVINPIIYAEVSVGYRRIEELEAAVPASDFERRALPWEAAFLAGKCFARYKRSSGHKRSPLPDFNIGAHAAIEELTLLTRDPHRYRAYFPKLSIIAP
jgi:predicted nucleic acid-binding protein